MTTTAMVCLVVCLLPACTASRGGTASQDASSTTSAAEPIRTGVRPLPVGAGIDYQLGGPSAVPTGVGVIVRDRTAAAPDGLYSICYVNGFQSQPEENGRWLRERPDLVLRDESGHPIRDEDWDELLLDVRPPTRVAVVALVGSWIEDCAAAGYDAVELDNLDSWTRSAGLLSRDDAVGTLAAYAGVAHRSGLAVAQKNAAEVTSRVAGTYADFAVVEDCGLYDECAVFVSAYAGRVLLVEYTSKGFAAACKKWFSAATSPARCRPGPGRRPGVPPRRVRILRLRLSG